ncbi:MAG: alpha-amylase family glycosyl hydrolase [bacterium]
MITQNDVIYFILTDRFCDGDTKNNQGVDKAHPSRYHGGDFGGIAKKIPYLKNLGVTCLWVTPVYLSIGRCGDSDGYHGYWALDFEKVDPHLYSKDPSLAEGSKEYLKKLVNKLHQAKIKVVLDMVVNHTGYHNDTYHSYSDKKIKDSWFNPPRSNGDEVKSALSGLPDLNHDLAEVVDYFVNNILDWIEETAIDAIRMDTVKHVEPAFWYFFKSYIRGKYRNITLLGEDLEYDVYRISEYQKAHDFDTLFDFPLCSVMKEVFIYHGPMTRLARPRLSDNEPKGILDMDKDYTNANRLVTLLDNHDLDKRFMTEILDKVGHWDRNLALEIFKTVLTFLFTTRGIPQIYYGTELGMEGRKDPDNRQDMPWEKFARGLEPKEGSEKEIFNHLRSLIKIRKENEAIPYGYLFTLYVDTFIYAYIREFRGNTIIVAINNGLKEMVYSCSIPIEVNTNIPPRLKEALKKRRVLDNLLDPNDSIEYENGRIQVKLGRKEARIYKLRLK